MKNKKTLRIRDFSISNTYTLGEIADMMKFYGSDCPVVCKFGNKNFRIVSDKTIDDKPILILKKN